MNMEMTMENKAKGRANPSLLEQIFLFLLNLNLVIIFQDLYSCVHYIIKALLYILSNIVRKMWIVESPRLQPGAESSSYLCESVEGEGHEKLNVEEVKTAMEKATLTLNSSGIAMLFEDELSVEEVKEAFGIFDDNRDGFIDAMELRNVLSTLNLSQASVAECEKMIEAFDEDGDGRIDFIEFVELLDYSFSS